MIVEIRWIKPSSLNATVWQEKKNTKEVPKLNKESKIKYFFFSTHTQRYEIFTEMNITFQKKTKKLLTFPSKLSASPNNDAERMAVTNTDNAPSGVTRVAGANA